VARFNLAEAPEARRRLADALAIDDPAYRLAAMLQQFPIPQRLREVGFDRGKVDDAAAQIGALAITAPRPASAADVAALLTEAY
jgi:alcohol dehydrogenase class IV